MAAPKAPEYPARGDGLADRERPERCERRLREVPPGYTFPMHWHSAAEYTSVISGKAQFTVNGKTYDLEPGSYIVIPAKAHHMAKCAPGAECVLLTRRAGPADYNWVK